MQCVIQCEWVQCKEFLLPKTTSHLSPPLHSHSGRPVHYAQIKCPDSLCCSSRCRICSCMCTCACLSLLQWSSLVLCKCLFIYLLFVLCGWPLSLKVKVLYLLGLFCSTETLILSLPFSWRQLALRVSLNQSSVVIYTHCDSLLYKCNLIEMNWFENMEVEFY